jgi:hypothetical protein
VNQRRTRNADAQRENGWGNFKRDQSRDVRVLASAKARRHELTCTQLHRKAWTRKERRGF